MITESGSSMYESQVRECMYSYDDFQCWHLDYETVQHMTDEEVGYFCQVTLVATVVVAICALCVVV